MIRQLLARLLGTPDSGVLVFALFLGGAVVLGSLLWLLRAGRSQEPGFGAREAELRKPSGKRGSFAKDALAHARLERKGEALRLDGIVLDGKPHEVLGLRAGAGADEVNQAYRTLMKRYHPDVVGRPGTREWQDAQKIAEALNRAKEMMLKDAASKARR